MGAGFGRANADHTPNPFLWGAWRRAGEKPRGIGWVTPAARPQHEACSPKNRRLRAGSPQPCGVRLVTGSHRWPWLSCVGFSPPREAAGTPVIALGRDAVWLSARKPWEGGPGRLFLAHGCFPPSLAAGGRKAQPWRAEAQAVLMAVVLSGTARGVWASLGVLQERQREGCWLHSAGS